MSATAKTPKASKRHVELMPGTLSLNLAKDGTFLIFQTADGRGACLNLDYVFDHLAIARETYRIWNADLRKKKGVK